MKRLPSLIDFQLSRGYNDNGGGSEEGLLLYWQAGRGNVQPAILLGVISAVLHFAPLKIRGGPTTPTREPLATLHNLEAPGG